MVELFEFFARAADFMMSKEQIQAAFGPSKPVSDPLTEHETVVQPKQSSAVLAKYQELLEVADQSLAHKIQYLLQMIFASQPPEDGFAVVDPLDYAYAVHE